MSTITSLNANDNGATSRGVINTNTDNLNTDKLENSSLTGATAKVTLANADTFPMNDSAASFALKKYTFSTLKSELLSYFNVFYTAVNTAIPLSYLDTDGTMAANSDTKVASQKAVRTYVAANGSTDWTTIATAPTTITNLGQRSYSLVYPGVDLTPTIHPGMRLRTTRTVSAPTQCTSLNGTTQYYVKTSPAAMTFTDDFTVSAWVKLDSYAQGVIASRFNNTSGWIFNLEAAGQVRLIGFNASSANFSQVLSYQAIPLGKLVHISAQLDMSAFTATTTTSYVMIDGVDVPAAVSRGGTNPTALLQAGDLQVGAHNGATAPFAGKLAQVAIFNAKVTQATMRGYISQGLSGSETSLISAYSFNNAITDLNTTNANNLTAQGSAVATDADSPFATNSYGTETATLDYALIQSVSYGAPDTTVTVQVPWGCTIPTSGGVATSAYSSVKAPYGFPTSADRWSIETKITAAPQLSAGGTTIGTVYNFAGVNLAVPIGRWLLSCNLETQSNPTSTILQSYFGLSTSSSAFIKGARDWGKLYYQSGIAAASLVITPHVVSNSELNNAAAVNIYPLTASSVAVSSASGIRGIPSTTVPEDSSIWAVPADL